MKRNNQPKTCTIEEDRSMAHDPDPIKKKQDSRPPNHSQLILECTPDSPFKTNKSDQITHPTLKQICVDKSTEGKGTPTKGTTSISPSMSTNKPKYSIQTWNELNPSLQYVVCSSAR